MTKKIFRSINNENNRNGHIKYLSLITIYIDKFDDLEGHFVAHSCYTSPL